MEILNGKVLLLQKQLKEVNASRTFTVNQVHGLSGEVQNHISTLEAKLMEKIQQKWTSQNQNQDKQQEMQIVHNDLLSSKLARDGDIRDSRIKQVEKALKEERTSRLEFEVQLTNKLQTKMDQMTATNHKIEKAGQDMQRQIMLHIQKEIDELSNDMLQLRHERTIDTSRTDDSTDMVCKLKNLCRII